MIDNQKCKGFTGVDDCRNAAVFRLLILHEQETDDEGRDIPPGIGSTFLCRDCLPSAIEGFPQASEVAYMVLPLTLATEQAKLLREAIREEGWEK